MTVSDFETLVLNQQPAAKAWQPCTDYSFEARKRVEGKHPQLIKDVFQPSAVLDVGCGPGHLVRLLRGLGVKAHGADREWNTAVDFQFDIAGDPISTLRRWSELVICREVLEHLTLRQIRRAVANLCDLTSRFVYLTTRFHPKPSSLLDVATSDDLDPTHISMTNQDFLRMLFVLEGFKRRADLETRMDWKKLGRCLVYERAV
jgi:hypothetical protein